jgi:hypothetical protein
MKRVHPTGFEPVTLGSEDHSNGVVSTLPSKNLRQIHKSFAAPQQHFGGPPCLELATNDMNHAANSLENDTHRDDDFQSLSRLIAVWPTLPAHARATILQIANVLSLPPNG